MKTPSPTLLTSPDPEIPLDHTVPPDSSSTSDIALARSPLSAPALCPSLGPL